MTDTPSIPSAVPSGPLASPSIAKLASALSIAQGQMATAPKARHNTYYRSDYADLAACWDVARKPLSDNGLAILQLTQATDGHTVHLTTILTHSSGEWISSDLVMIPTLGKKKDGEDDSDSGPAKRPTPQALGSCLTYARRYAFCAIVGIAASDDDDGNAASLPTTAAPPPSLDEQPAGLPAIDAAMAEASGDRERMEDLFPPVDEPGANDEPPPPTPPALVPPAKSKPNMAELDSLIEEIGITETQQAAWCSYFQVERLDELTQDQVDAIVAKVRTTTSRKGA